MTQEELVEISNAAHDLWFDVAEITLGPDRVLGIPLSGDTPERNLFMLGFLTHEIPVRRYLLEIGSVVRYVVNESEGVGTYDIAEITFDESTVSVVIRSMIPLELRVVVSQLDVRLNEIVF